MFLPVVRVAEISLVDGGIPELDKEVVWEEVHEEVRRLDGGRLLVWTGLSRNCSRRRAVGTAMEVALVSLYNHAWRKLEWPADWQRAYFTLFKGDGPGYYRLLAISSVVVKLFEKILDRRIQVWSERVGLLSDLQGGFRAGRGTVGPPVCLE